MSPDTALSFPRRGCRAATSRDFKLALAAAAFLSLVTSSLCADDALDQEAARKQFSETYRLDDGDVLQHIPPPFVPIRHAYYRLSEPGQAAAIPEGPATMYVRIESGQPEIWGMTFGAEERSVDDLARMLLKLSDVEIVGDPELREQGLAGDFVYDPSASQEDLAAAIQELFRSHGVPVDIRFRDLEREVYVATGEFDFLPLPDSPNKHIEFFGLALDTDNSGYGGGNGELGGMLQEAGEWISTPIVNDVEKQPARRLSWHRNDDARFTELERKMARDPELVLSNLTVQTGLVFTKTRRKVRSLMVGKRPLAETPEN
ncbi:MAG: hypothetical protein KDA75_12160 [Planctomycetaceae bacterium]|nr:hypothetical protein [Planctomycetaceae bacterium]